TLELNGFLLKWTFLLCLSIGLLLHSIASQIPLGSKLSVFENKFLVSPNGDFTFGFFNGSEHPNQFKLGVYLNSKSILVDQQTVVWVVGTDLTVGQLQLRWDIHFTYWTSKIPSGSNLMVFLTFDVALQIRDQRWEPTWLVFGEDHNDSIHYRYLRLDVDGNLRLYLWLEASQSWRLVLQAIENQCNVFATCGQYGIFVYTESGSRTCKCPFKLTNQSIPTCFVPPV
ncbi:Bulb-type lectin domain containing protein, partial [Parasponia andersonii]